VGKTKKSSEEVTAKRRRPASSPEARENQMIALAVDLAEEQLMNGTASTAVITHYLRLGSLKEQREREKLDEEIKLLRAKTEAYESAKDMKEVYAQALEAMKRYSGNVEEVYDEY
jgi:hypothetical protein